MSGYSANFDLCIFDVILIEDGTVEELYMSKKILGMLVGSDIQSQQPTSEDTNPKQKPRAHPSKIPYSTDPFPTPTQAILWVGVGKTVDENDGQIKSDR